jgi:hypothetical protein
MGGVITAERIALLIDGAPTWAVTGLIFPSRWKSSVAATSTLNNPR